MIDSKQAWTAAYILHKRAYKESSQLLKLFSFEHGLVDGAFRHKKSSVDYFTPLMVELKGKSELRTISKCEAVGNAIMLQGNSMYAGLYINELLSYTLSPHEPMPLTFAAYGSVMQAVAKLGCNAGVLDVAWYLRVFEIILLQELGLLASFEQDVDGKTLDPQQRYVYLPSKGFSLYQPAQHQTTAQSLVVLGSEVFSVYRLIAQFIEYTNIIDTDASNTLEPLSYKPEQVRLLKKLLSPLIAQLLAGRTLRSRELWQLKSITK